MLLFFGGDFFDCVDQLMDIEAGAPCFKERVLCDSASEVLAFARILFHGRRDEGPEPSFYVDDSIAFELLVRLRDSAGVDDELGREVAHGRQRVLGLEFPDDNGAPNLVHYLEVERPKVSVVESYEQVSAGVAV